MELRQRSQRPSESTGQNPPPQWNNSAQTPRNAPPPPPPQRTPSVSSSVSSPMFHNPNSYSSQQSGNLSGSMRNLSSSARNLSSSVGSFNSAASGGGGTPYQRHRASATGYTPSYNAGAAATPYGRSQTEPHPYDSSGGNVASAPNRQFSYSNDLSGSTRSVNSYSSSGGYDAGNAGYYASTPASTAANNTGYGGYTPNNPTPPTSSNLNPYKTKKSNSNNKCVKFLYISLILAMALLSVCSLYFRHAIKTTAVKIEEMHHVAHKRHLSNVKRTGGRHSSHHNRNIANQQREVEQLELSNKQVQRDIDARISEFNALREQQETLQGKLEGLEMTTQNTMRSIAHETASVENLHAEKEEYEAMLVSKERLDEVVVKREEALWKRVDRLGERIGRESERENIDWFQKNYGSGPHKIEIELSYPDVPPEDHPNPQSWNRVSRWIVIELAPVSLMPHSVNTFMRQVYHKMWQNMPLVLNDENKLQFGPREKYGEQKQFGTNFSNLLYQEYSAEYPHEKWTIGFAGRPAGPDFYINMQDNTQLYGPTDDKHAEADPCFGKITEGFDILERIASIPHYNGGDEEDLAKYYEVKILNAFLIRPKFVN